MKFFSLQDSFRNLDGTCAADRTTGRPPLKPSECLLLLADVDCNCFAGYGVNMRRLCVDVKTNFKQVFMFRIFKFTFPTIQKWLLYVL